eukprot:4393838-Amphidinium_carterae.1
MAESLRIAADVLTVHLQARQPDVSRHDTSCFEDAKAICPVAVSPQTIKYYSSTPSAPILQPGGCKPPSSHR